MVSRTLVGNRPTPRGDGDRSQVWAAEGHHRWVFERRKKLTLDATIRVEAQQAALGLQEGQIFTLATSTKSDDVRRELPGLRVTFCSIPRGCVGTYYPEANVLVAIRHYAEGSKVPVSKSVAVRVVAGAR